MARVMVTRLDPRPRRRTEKVRGWRSFVTTPVKNAPVIVEIGDRRHEARTDRGGYIDCVVESDLEPGWGVIRLSSADAEPVEAPVRVVDPGVRFGVVSDIDDTVMVTALPRPLLAAWNTFVLDEHARVAVPGMAVLYERLATRHPDAPVLYLSTGAWNVAPDVDALPVPPSLPRRTAAAHRLGPDPRPVVPQRAGAQAVDPRPAGRRSSRTSAGCSSATTASMTRRSTRSSRPPTPTTSRRWRSVACHRHRPCWPEDCRHPTTIPDRPGRRAQKWFSAPDGAGLWRQLRDAGVI